MLAVEQLKFRTPVLRVNDRQQNIAFYQDVLGLRLVSEENALAFFSDWGQQTSHFTIEESPAYRTRQAQGRKKLRQLVLKANQASEIEGLLARDISVTQLFYGEKGYAFEVISPQGDCILLHAENDVKQLRPISYEGHDWQSQPNFKGLSAYQVEAIVLNVPDVKHAEDFYALFDGQLPLTPTFVQRSGADLTCEPNVTWDLEILEFTVSKDFDLLALKAYLESRQQNVYLDRAETVLSVSDNSRIDVWFRK